MMPSYSPDFTYLTQSLPPPPQQQHQHPLSMNGSTGSSHTPTPWLHPSITASAHSLPNPAEPDAAAARSLYELAGGGRLN